jgi:16S rRNA (guanine527-N7)-methyltransferase
MSRAESALWKPVERILSEQGIDAEAVIPVFEVYVDLLMEWNQRTNLTAHRTPQDMVIHHFVDSLMLLSVADLPQGTSMVDVGSGAGFPGLPIRIARPDIHLSIIESKHKAVEFLSEATSVLKIKDVPIVTDRAEIAGREDSLRESFDCAVARALAKVSVACEYLLPLVKIGGKVYLWAGPSFEDDSIAVAIDTLGGEYIVKYPYSLPDGDSKRWIVEIAKTRATPTSYPRRTGIPKKRPL